MISYSFPVLPLRKSRLWTKNLERDLAKVRHLVIGDEFHRELRKLDAENGKGQDIRDGGIRYKDLPTIFPNLERITFETSDFGNIKWKLWNTHVAISRQRLIGDAWFAHLPLSALRPNRRNEIQEFLGAIRKMTEKFPE